MTKKEKKHGHGVSFAQSDITEDTSKSRGVLAPLLNHDFHTINYGENG